MGHRHSLLLHPWLAHLALLPKLPRLTLPLYFELPCERGLVALILSGSCILGEPLDVLLELAWHVVLLTICPRWGICCQFVLGCTLARSNP